MDGYSFLTPSLWPCPSQRADRGKQRLDENWIHSTTAKPLTIIWCTRKRVSLFPIVSNLQKGRRGIARVAVGSSLNDDRYAKKRKGKRKRFELNLNSCSKRIYIYRFHAVETISIWIYTFVTTKIGEGRKRFGDEYAEN